MSACVIIFLMSAPTAQHDYKLRMKSTSSQAYHHDITFRLVTATPYTTHKTESGK